VITSKAFDIAECQFVLFTPGLQFSVPRILASMLPVTGGLYDADPVVLPNTDELPPEVPRIILSSRDGQHRMQASAVRFDVFRRALPEHPGPTLTEALSTCLPIISSYVKATNAVVERLAVVLKRIAPVDEPAKLLARHFCKEQWLQGPLNRPQQFELHAHKVFEVPGSVKVNSWFRIKTAILKLPQPSPGILVEQDFNTLKEEAHECKQEEIENFFRSVIPAFDEVLELYFPNAVSSGSVNIETNTHA
jgi:hypothetical protein